MANAAKNGFNPKVFLAKVGTGKTISKYRKDQAIFAQGDIADTIFYIQKGKVKIVVVSDAGKEAVVGIMEPEQFFGEGCLNGHSLRIATAKAMEECLITSCAKLGETSNLGVISAVFFRERHPIVVATPRRSGRVEDKEDRIDNEEAPDSSSAGQSRGRNNDSDAPKSKSAEAYPGPDDESAATGIGRNMRHDVRWVNMDLENRATAEVTLRYEYRAGLVRLGIQPRPYPYRYPDTLGRRERASGFEDRRYSPEP
jgi:hypothetical protein